MPNSRDPCPWAENSTPNLMKLRPERPEEKPLREFLRSTDLSIHPRFTRYYLDLIIAV